MWGPCQFLQGPSEPLLCSLCIFLTLAVCHKVFFTSCCVQSSWLGSGTKRKFGSSGVDHAIIIWVWLIKCVLCPVSSKCLVYETTFGIACSVHRCSSPRCVSCRHWFPDGAFWHTSEYLMGNKHCQALSSSPGSRRIHSCE